MLELESIQTFYGPSQILFDVSLRVDAGEMVTLMGRNGMGKTTTVRSIMGLTRPRAGTIRFRGAEIQGWPSYAVARAGIGLVPEGRQVFPNLTVRENLLVAAGYGSDEATEGLAPLVCAEIWRCLERLKAVGQAILLIDSNHGALMQIADRHYIMEKGRITWTGDSAALAAAEDIRQRYLGV